MKNGDVSDTLRVRVTAKNSDGNAQADLGPDGGRHREGRAAADERERLSGEPDEPDPGRVDHPAGRSSIDGQQVEPNPISRSSSDITVRIHVSACSGHGVRAR